MNINIKAKYSARARFESALQLKYVCASRAIQDQILCEYYMPIFVFVPI